MNIIKLWKNRNQILEGVKNSIFRTEHVEEIAEERITICKSNQCGSFDLYGNGCAVPGTQPCCSQLNGGCGCSLFLKTRSLSSSCPKNFWSAILTETEEDELNQSISTQK